MKVKLELDVTSEQRAAIGRALGTLKAAPEEGVRVWALGILHAALHEIEHPEDVIRPLNSGGFAISSHGAWLPGIYADRQAARQAFQLTDPELLQLSARICHQDSGEGRAITLEDLGQVRDARKEKMP